MFSHRVLSSASTTARRLASLLSPSQRPHSPILSRHFHSVPRLSTCESIPVVPNSSFDSCSQQRCWISSTASPRPTEKGEEVAVENDTPHAEAQVAKTNGDAAEKPGSGSESRKTEPRQSAKRRRRGPKRVAFSDSDSEGEGEPLSMEKLAKLVAKEEELLKLKHKEIEKMQDKVCQSYAEMENMMDRTKREAENSKKYAIQSFAKGLLDVADNLGRASSVVKDSFAKIDSSGDMCGAVPLLKTLLEGVDMTEKQLVEAFKKFGIEKYDPTGEPFDSHRHNAVLQMPDSSKPSGTVAAVLKAGYVLHDRVLRPADVGVTQSTENDPAESNTAERGLDAS